MAEAKLLQYGDFKIRVHPSVSEIRITLDGNNDVKEVTVNNSPLIVNKESVCITGGTWKLDFSNGRINCHAN